MHARLDELLSLRDGAPVDARVRGHVGECAECASELERTESLQEQLCALPAAPEAASDGWPVVRARLAGSRTERLTLLDRPDRGKPGETFGFLQGKIRGLTGQSVVEGSTEVRMIPLVGISASA